MSATMVRVKLLSARAGNSYDGKSAKGLPHGRLTGVFSQAVGDIVEMDADEAQRHFDRGLATPAPQETKRG